MTPAELQRLRQNQLNAKFASERLRGSNSRGDPEGDDFQFSSPPEKTRRVRQVMAMSEDEPILEFRKPYKPPAMQFTPHDGMTITLPIPPSVNDWKTPITRITKPTMILTKAYREWRARAHAAFDAFKVNGPLLRGPLEIAVTFRFATIASDIDGPLKPLLDAANGYLWVDDSHVCRIASVEKLLAGPNEAPHVVLTVRTTRSDGEPWDAEIVKRLAKSKRKAK